jgi:hypothetical protein
MDEEYNKKGYNPIRHVLHRQGRQEDAQHPGDHVHPRAPQDPAHLGRKPEEQIGQGQDQKDREKDHH